MAFTATSGYKGFAVVQTAPPTGAAAAMLQANWMEAGDRLGPSKYNATTFPLSTWDGVDTASVGLEFEVGSRVVNVTTNQSWICVDNTTSTAIWKITADSLVDKGEVNGVITPNAQEGHTLLYALSDDISDFNVPSNAQEGDDFTFIFDNASGNKTVTWDAAWEVMIEVASSTSTMAFASGLNAYTMIRTSYIDGTHRILALVRSAL